MRSPGAVLNVMSYTKPILVELTSIALRVTVSASESESMVEMARRLDERVEADASVSIVDERVTREARQ